MKNSGKRSTAILALAAAIVAFGFISCQGPAGPMGPKGDDGTSGGSAAPRATVLEIMDALVPAFVAAMTTNPANDGLTTETAFTFRPTGYSLLDANAMTAVYTLVKGYWVNLDLSGMGGNSFGHAGAGIDKSRIRSVTLGQDVSTIISGTDETNGAFAGFNGLQRFTGNGVIVVGAHAFRNAAALTDIALPEARVIGYAAFFEAASLTSINFPQATDIGITAFYGTRIVEANLPEARVIGGGAFMGVTSLTDINLPEARVIGANAFSTVSSLTDISLPQATIIGGSAFAETNIARADLPQAKVIGDYAFYDVTSLTGITLPKARDIGEAAFVGTNITQADLPEARVIGWRAFSNVTSLTAVILPNVESIESWAFDSCTALASITINNATPPTLVNADAFANTAANLEIFVPSASVDAYKAAANWNHSSIVNRIKAR